MLPIRPLLYSDSSLETGSCTGPRYTRNAPSRETPGVLLNEVTDKYVTEFNLPYMNVARYVKEMDSNWSKLSPEQKTIILQSIAKFQADKNLVEQEDTFANDGTSGPDQSVAYFNYLETEPSSLGPFLNNIKHSGNPLLTQELNSFIGSNSWSMVLIVIIIILIICILILVSLK